MASNNVENAPFPMTKEILNLLSNMFGIEYLFD